MEHSTNLHGAMDLKSDLRGFGKSLSLNTSRCNPMTNGSFRLGLSWLIWGHFGAVPVTFWTLFLMIIYRGQMLRVRGRFSGRLRTPYQLRAHSDAWVQGRI